MAKPHPARHPHLLVTSDTTGKETRGERLAASGPIRERSGGRVMDIEDLDAAAADADIDFDDPATSRPTTETDDDDA